MFKIFSSKKGFSLVELIVVIAILGVISAIAIPAVLNTLADSKIKADVATAQAISKAVAVSIVSANSDTITTNDIAATDDLTDANLKAQIDKTFPTIPTPQSNSAGAFSVTVNSVANSGEWDVKFTDNNGKIHTIDEAGKETIAAASSN